MLQSRPLVLLLLNLQTTTSFPVLLLSPPCPHLSLSSHLAYLSSFGLVLQYPDTWSALTEAPACYLTVRLVWFSAPSQRQGPGVPMSSLAPSPVKILSSRLPVARTCSSYTRVRDKLRATHGSFVSSAVIITQIKSSQEHERWPHRALRKACNMTVEMASV